MNPVTDLHTHTSASDGAFSPRELIEKAVSVGLSSLAITDHDTIDGLEEGERACKERGILFIPGIEIEIEHQGGEFHLLGLGLQQWRGPFWTKLRLLEEQRLERNLVILSKMRADGIRVDYEELKQLAGGNIVGRPHIAQYLVQKGVAVSVEDAFQRFISQGKPYYVKKKALDLQRGTELIHSAGGKAIIAHPPTLQLPANTVEDTLRSYKDKGVDGIEAFHPQITLSEGAQWADLADKLGLLVSAGSDFHGPNIPDRELGKSSEGKPIEDSFAVPYISPCRGILTV